MIHFLSHTTPTFIRYCSILYLTSSGYEYTYVQPTHTSSLHAGYEYTYGLWLIILRPIYSMCVYDSTHLTGCCGMPWSRDEDSINSSLSIEGENSSLSSSSVILLVIVLPVLETGGEVLLVSISLTIPLLPLSDLLSVDILWDL